ncbi:ATP-binding protein [Paenibacillus naphthalenovorans]|uniref:ATP-binding protein n=1 Tax=Paenibacillus naphthalenovorans TaxID=162209 RepID=UPI00088DA621|nr:4Fe-4S binding protein [Paenibacillus naphthalenovorans]SDI49187.1 4Fe-4S dicluster domain-containing protein [Paenibacillus naphthalenovorans]
MITVKDSCTACGACVPVCPVQALVYTDDRQKVAVEKSCVSCNLCIPACPIAAIEEVIQTSKPNKKDKKTEVIENGEEGTNSRV